jgi:hypothetical protein
VARLRETLKRVDEQLAGTLADFANTNDANRGLLLDFIMELYWLRSAELVSRHIDKDWERLSLGEAVGASACFPPVFPPMTEFGIYDDAHVARLGFTDGGVFDNMGVTALLDERCTHIIASDTSGLFHTQRSCSTTRLTLPQRIMSILMKDLGSWQRDILRERRRASRLITQVCEGHASVLPDLDPACANVVRDLEQELAEFHSIRELRGLAYFHIDSPPKAGGPSLPLPVERSLVASVRTDLDGFGDAEIAALANYGYVTADMYVRTYLADFCPTTDSKMWVEPALPKAMPGKDESRDIIKAGKSRFFRALQLGAPLSWLWTIASTAFAVWIVWRLKLGLGDAVSGVPDAVAWLTIWDGWMTVPIRWVIYSAILLIAFWIVSRRMRRHEPPTSAEQAQCFEDPKRRRRQRWLGRAGKVLRGYAGVLLFFFGWLPLILVGLLTVYSWINWTLFHWPFRWKTAAKAHWARS